MSQEVWIYGKHPVLEWLRNQPQNILKVGLLQGSRDVSLEKGLENTVGVKPPCVYMSRQEIEKKVGKVVHQGVVAQVRGFEYAEIESVLEKVQDANPLWVALDHIQDPHNVGAVLRTAHAMGCTGVLMPKDRACEVTPVVMKSSAGAAAHIPVCKVTNLNRALDALKDRGYWVVGLAAEGAQLLDEIDCVRPLVLVVGSEGDGLSKGVRDRCDYVAKIAMKGQVGSLNASVACGMALYEIVRQQSKKSG
jgi:23S rRNA (guanosine2251-2'-O)-methyltransferase